MRPQRLQIRPGTVASQYRLVKLHPLRPGRLQPGQQAGVAIKQTTKQDQRAEPGLGGLGEQQERQRPGQHRPGSMPSAFASVYSRTSLLSASRRSLPGPSSGTR